MPIESLILYGVPAVLIIVALVQVAKGYGMDAKWAPLLAVGLGVLLAVCAQLATQSAAFDAWYRVVLGGLLAGLVACGAYSAQKALRGM